MASPLLDELEATFRAQRSSLVGWLRRQFDVLSEPECEDVVQFAFLQAIKAIEGGDFHLTHTWMAWLRQVARNAAISYLRGMEEQSLDALAAGHGSEDRSERRSIPLSDHGALTPSQYLAKAERGERRRLLVSDLLRSYVAHVEQYGMWVQAEVFERSLRGQKPAQMALEMELPPARVYEHRARAFEWLRGKIHQQDSRGSILASAFQPAAAVESDSRSEAAPRHITDVVQWAINTVGALCPSPARLRAAGPDVAYHVRFADGSGCRLCRFSLANDHVDAV